MEFSWGQLNIVTVATFKAQHIATAASYKAQNVAIPKSCKSVFLLKLISLMGPSCFMLILKLEKDNINGKFYLFNFL